MNPSHINPVHAHEEPHQAVFMNTIGDLGCRPNLFCFGKGSLKERYIQQDACLSVCFLPDGSYVHYTRAQRTYSLVASVILVVVGLGMAETLAGKLSSAMDPTTDRANRATDDSLNCTWTVLQEKKGCSDGLTYSVTGCTVNPWDTDGAEDADGHSTRMDGYSNWPEWLNDDYNGCSAACMDADPETNQAHLQDVGAGGWFAEHKFMANCMHIRDLETCQFAATQQPDCSNVIVFGESDDTQVECPTPWGPHGTKVMHSKGKWTNTGGVRNGSMFSGRHFTADEYKMIGGPGPGGHYWCPSQGITCQCLIQLDDWTENAEETGVEFAKQCDFIQPRRGSTSDVYQRTCTHDTCKVSDVHSALREVGVPCDWTDHAIQLFWMKVYHYLLEFVTGMQAFRCIRKRATRRGHARRQNECKDCCDMGCTVRDCPADFVICWVVSIGPTIMLFGLAMYSVAGENQEPGFGFRALRLLAINFTFYAMLETVVTNAIGIADFLVAGGPDC